MQHKAHNPGFLAIVNEAKSRVREITIQQYVEIAAEEHTLIDTREDNEWQAGHAQGAIHLSKGIIERDIETRIPEKSTRLILYCGGGYRSALAADAIQKMGYRNVLSFAGGWRAWQEAGLPLA